MNLPGRHKAGPLSPTVPLRVSPQAHAPGDAVGVALNTVILP
jgi:hypothetical protein